MSAPIAHIPLTVIGGFLGSGKTTLINHVLSSQHSCKAVILVNDFGAVNVDSQLIEDSDGDVISLSNGCVCCSIGDDLTDTLIRVLEMNPEPEWIIIEASGVADPGRIAAVGASDPGLITDGVVVLVDSEKIQAYARDERISDTVLRQIGAADVIILNKSDRIPIGEIKEVRYWTETQAPHATFYTTHEGVVPIELLRSPIRSTNNAHGASKSRRYHLQESADQGQYHDNQFASWTYETDRLLDKEKLKLLLEDMPSYVIRAKGLVCVGPGHNQKLVFQFAGNTKMLKPYGPCTDNHTSIVFIGILEFSDFSSLENILRDAEL